MTSTRLGALLLATLLVTGACADGPDAPVSAASSSEPGEPAGPRVVTPETGLRYVVPSAWEDADLAPDGRSARLTWYSGIEECNGLARVTVRYKARTVVVTLFAGARPGAGMCPDIAEQVVTDVHFDEPLGDRKLVDGSRLR